MQSTQYTNRLIIVAAGALLACSRIDPRPATDGAQGSLTEPDEPSIANAAASAKAVLVPITSSLLNGNENQQALTSPYPRGRWRLARAEDLFPVVLWLEHILIRHRDVPAGVISFELPDWTSAPQAPERTREAAFALAEELAKRAAAGPERFGDLARESSEDVATREAGGSLGGYGAFQLSAWPQVLDALATLGPEQVSRVVETPFGFHVFRRRAPPPEARVSAARIIIGHDDAPWLQKHLARSSVPARARLDALAIANQLYETARANPGEFSRLVHEYSEHQDAVRAGDFGEWSTRERTPFRRAVEISSQLQVGEVAPPVDSLFGYQVIQRTPNRPRATYRMNSITVGFDTAQPDAHPQSRVSAGRMARVIADTLQSKPFRFGEFQRQFCCTATETWVEGRESAPVEQALARLAVGEIGREPVQTAASFRIIQRLEPEPSPPATFQLELPAPERADVEYLVVHGGWLMVLDSARQEAERALHLDAERASRFTALHEIDEPMNAAADSDLKRVELYNNLQRQVSQLLGPEEYGRYVEIIERHFREKLVGDSAFF